MHTLRKVDTIHLIKTTERRTVEVVPVPNCESTNKNLLFTFRNLVNFGMMIRQQKF